MTGLQTVRRWVHRVGRDLVGFAAVTPEPRLNLAQTFDLPGRPPAQRANRLDETVAASLIHLPAQITGTLDEPDYRSLPAQDLLRGAVIDLPSGESVAAELSVEAGPKTPTTTPVPAGSNS